ncbi:hypothetical protein PIB30_068986 [Stylosanthes scabra]|uniref:MATH domain-containing protein n=1 Tax=Stylosanthes scabra TaxID=79078 RepID=A0ABU6QN25_9FABA|nr:hypothetical protein [Stylosanthes scabra]
MSTTVKFTWFIWNFSKLNRQYIYSDTFFTGNHPWRILLYPQGGMRKGYLSIYLSTGDGSVLSAGSWSKTANFKLTLHNYYSTSKTFATKYKFGSGSFSSFGYPCFITSSEFDGPNNGYLVNDACTIIAEVTVENSGHQHSNDNRIMPSPVTLNKDNNNNNLVDFKGLCKVRRDFVPLLDDVCSKHPKLVESQKGKSLSEKSFTALGRVLYFLTSYKNVKDMNDDAVKELQSLWEELESSGFEDLTWLKNDVNFALGIKEELEEEEKGEEEEEGEGEGEGELLKVE